MTRALRGVDRGGRQRAGGGEGARGSPGSLPRHVSYRPLTSPSWTRGSPPSIALSPPPGFPWAPTRPPPRLPSGSPAPGHPLAQSASRAPAGLHAASWAAGAGAEARGSSFTRSLKYLGKPQSGAAWKWPLACFGGRGTGAWAKVRESDGPPISETGPHWQVSPWAWGRSGVPGEGGASWAPSDAEGAPGNLQTSNRRS